MESGNSKGNKEMKLTKHILNFDLALDYSVDNLQGTNALSSKLVELIPFYEGNFFTLIRKESDINKIHQFEWYGVLGGIRDQSELFVLDYLLSNPELSCVFDDYNSTYKPESTYSLFLQTGLVYGNEIYYLVTQKNASLELLEECFCASDAQWHALCVLTSANLDLKSKFLSIEQIEEICLKTQLIVLGAYDSEGYVFWERKT